MVQVSPGLQSAPGVGPGGRQLTSQEVARRRRERIQGRQLSQRQGGTFTDIGSILGVDLNRRLGNVTARDGSRLRSAGEIAGQTDITLSEKDRSAVEQFFSPRVTEDQQARLASLAKKSAAQGLIGGAPSSQIEDFTTQFLASNRAQSFGRTRDVISARLGQVKEETSPFLQQIQTLRGLSSQPTTNVVDPFFTVPTLSGVNRASGVTSEQFQDFADPALQALSAVGLGGDAIAGLAQRSGVIVGQGGTTGSADVGQFFSSFLAPEGLGAEPAVRAFQRAGTAGIAGGSSQRTRAFAGVIGQSRGLERLAAGQRLASRVGGVVSELNREATEFGTLGAAASTFAQTGDIGAARRLANIDFSEFEGLTTRLGLGRGVRSSGGARQFLQGAGLQGNLFNTIVGA